MVQEYLSSYHLSIRVTAHLIALYGDFRDIAGQKYSRFLVSLASITDNIVFDYEAFRAAVDCETISLSVLSVIFDKVIPECIAMG